MAKVTAFHNPRGMVDYSPIPFRDIAFVGEGLRKTSDKAFDLANEMSNLQVNALEQDRERRNELLTGIEDQLGGIYDTYKTDPRQALDMARRLGVSANKNMSRGELAAIKSRYDQYHAIDKDLQDRFMDVKSPDYNPDAYNFYKGNIRVDDLNYNQDSGIYGSVASPRTHRLWSPEEKTKWFDQELDNIEADTLIKPGAKGYGTGVSFKKLLETDRSLESIDFDKVKNVLIGLVRGNEELLNSEEVQGLMRGVGPGQSQFIYEDEQGNIQFNPNSQLGSYLQGIATARTYEKEKKGSTHVITDVWGFHKAKAALEDQKAFEYVSSTNSTAHQITPESYGEFKQSLQTARQEMDSLEAMLKPYMDDPLKAKPADYNELLSQYQASKSNYFTLKNKADQVESSTYQTLSAQDKKIVDLQKEIEAAGYDTESGVNALLQAAGITPATQPYGAQYAGSAAQKKNLMSLMKLRGLNFADSNKANTAYREASKNFQSKIKTAIEKDPQMARTPIVFRGTNTGKFATSVGNIQAQVTKDYNNNAGIGWSTMSGQPAEAMIADKYAKGTKKQLALTDDVDSKGNPVFEVSIIDDDGVVLGTELVTKDYHGRNEAMTVAGDFIQNGSPAQQETGFTMWGKLSYANKVRSVDPYGMKFGKTNKRLLPFKAADDNSDLYLVKTRGANPNTHEYQIIDGDGDPYTNVVGGEEQLYNVLAKQDMMRNQK